jgi:hypothetical protein
MRRVLIALTLCALTAAPLFGEAKMTEIAPRLEMSDALLLPRGEEIYQRGARVACGKGMFLIVWQEGYHGLGGDSSILGIRVDKNGKQLDRKPIEICTEKSVQECPAVAFCEGKFLVVWADLRNGTDYDIYGTLVEADGRIGRKNGARLAGGAGTQFNPAIASDGKDTFLVVWQDRRGGKTFDIYASRVTAAKGGTKPVGLLMTAGTSPSIAHYGSGYLVALCHRGCLVGDDGTKKADLAQLWRPAKKSKPSDTTAAWGKMYTFYNVSSRPDPWGWGGNGSIIGITITPDGQSLEFGKAKHGWYDAAKDRADRRTKNAVDAARWRNHEHWPMGMPGGFKGSHENTWPSGRPAVAFNGRSLVVVWTRAHFVGMHDLGTHDLYMKRVLDGWAYVDEPKLKIVAGATDEAQPRIAADLEGNAVLTYEKHQPEGGIGVEYRVIREREDTDPPKITCIARRSPTSMVLHFDEPVDAASAGKTENYVIEGITVHSAAYRAENPFLMRQVILETDEQKPGTAYALKVTGVQDLSAKKNAARGETYTYTCKPGVSQDSDFIERWNVVGPFPDNWKVDFVDPKTAKPSPGDTVAGKTADEIEKLLREVVSEEDWIKYKWDDSYEKQFGGDKTWRVASSSAGILRIAKCFGKLRKSSMYAHTYIYSDRDRDVIVRVDTNDGNRAWLNGELLHEDHSGHGIHAYTNESPSKLKKGWNRLLIEVANEFGQWMMVSQVTDTAKQPIRDLTYRLENPF